MYVKAVLRKGLLLVLLLAAAVILQPVPPSPTVVIFSVEPVATAVWEVTSPHNYIGSVIKAIVTVITEADVSLDLKGVPDAGMVLVLPVKPVEVPKPSPLGGNPYFGEHYSPPVIYEGELEILSRTITQYDEGGKVITEITYEFMYLGPIDLSAPTDDKRMPANLSIYKEFLLVVGEEETVVSKRVYVPVESTDFFIEPRVDGSKPPIDTEFPLTPPVMYWREVRLVGFGFIGLAACIIVLRGIRLISLRRREELARIPIPPVPVETFIDEWRQTGDYDVFKKALVCFLNGTWGRKPSTSMKVRSYFIVFSGVILSHDQIESVFAQVIREVHHDTP